MEFPQGLKPRFAGFLHVGAAFVSLAKKAPTPRKAFMRWLLGTPTLRLPEAARTG